MRFATTDDLSGIAGYELSINDGSFITQTSPATLSDLVVGDYYLKVKATDKAGNAVYGLATMRVYPKGTLPQTAVNDKPILGTKNFKTQLPLLIIIGLGIILIFAIIRIVTRKKIK